MEGASAVRRSEDGPDHDSRHDERSEANHAVEEDLASSDRVLATAVQEVERAEDYEVERWRD